MPSPASGVAVFPLPCTYMCYRHDPAVGKLRCHGQIPVQVEEAHWFSKDAMQTLLKGSAVPGHPLQTGLMDPDAQFYLPPPVTISHVLLKHWVELPRICMVGA